VKPAVLIANPLDAGLQRYTRALNDVLLAAGADVTTVSVPEPSASGASRFEWLARYVISVARQRSGRWDKVILAWPALGYWDLVAASALGLGRAEVVLHDPRPLVHARGYGVMARGAASSRLARGQAIVHSKNAQVEVKQATTLARLSLLPLPIFSPRSKAPSGDPVVRVLGQYKRDRDLDALERIAKDAPPGWALEIVGRGWPPVAGWTVRNLFITEDEFSALLGTSAVVLVPYRRFFQSEVAVRALEAGTPVVGPENTSLEELLGAASPWLVRGDDWVAAIDRALAADAGSIHDLASKTREEVVIAWTAWLHEDSAAVDVARRTEAVPSTGHAS
jgi:hypothetical protein